MSEKEREWEVETRVTHVEVICVKAPTSWEAAAIANERLAEKREVGRVVQLRAEVLRQLGEPWVYVSWYDLHEPGDVIVAQRAYGNRFTAADVALLKQRIESFGLTVMDCWNGEGCDSCSFQCSGRRGTHPFTEAERAILNAPRPS